MSFKPIVVLISADGEWNAVRDLLLPQSLEKTPFGETYLYDHGRGQIRFLKSGFGKISSAAATQYAIDRYCPPLLVNLGTCGGLEGLAVPGEILLVEETVVYDIIELMSDYAQTIDYYRSYASYSWIVNPLPSGTRKCRLASADQDIQPEKVSEIAVKFSSPAADWESGAIAWTAARNHVPWLILRGVSDIVSVTGSETTHNLALWQDRTKAIMSRLLKDLPWYLAEFRRSIKNEPGLIPGS